MPPISTLYVLRRSPLNATIESLYKTAPSFALCDHRFDSHVGNTVMIGTGSLDTPNAPIRLALCLTDY